MLRSALILVCATTAMTAMTAMTATSLTAQQPAPALTAAPSTRATTVVSLNPPRGSQGINPARIRIDYGQPHLRGRALHTSDLVPLDSVWRMGANEATELEAGVDLLIGGHSVPKGKYTLFALPTASAWKLIVNKNTGQWGTDYKVEHDHARIDLSERTLTSPVESLSIWLIPSTQPGPPSGELRISWGDTQLSTTWAAKQ
ncbi:MAG: DUF2911 domain-containing protein [Gemmatimonadaceae bacterium]